MLPLELAGRSGAREAAADVLGESRICRRDVSTIHASSRAASNSASRSHAHSSPGPHWYSPDEPTGNLDSVDRRAHHRIVVRAESRRADHAGRRHARQCDRATVRSHDSASMRARSLHEGAKARNPRTGARWQIGRAAVLMLALLVAVSALTAVGFFHQPRESRGRSASWRSACGGPASAIAFGAGSRSIFEMAADAGLKTAELSNFPSVVFNGEDSALTAIRAVAPEYPLRGRVEVADVPFGPAQEVTTTPGPGEAWLEARLVRAARRQSGRQDSRRIERAAPRRRCSTIVPTKALSSSTSRRPC